MTTTPLAAGLVTSAATAILTELEPGGDTCRASRVSTAASIFGLGLGPVLAGVLAQYGPLPIRLPYAAYLGLLIPALAPASAGTRAGDPERDVLICALRAVEQGEAERRGWDRPAGRPAAAPPASGPLPTGRTGSRPPRRGGRHRRAHLPRQPRARAGSRGGHRPARRAGHRPPAAPTGAPDDRLAAAERVACKRPSVRVSTRWQGGGGAHFGMARRALMVIAAAAPRIA
jgi:hypothetical protein